MHMMHLCTHRHAVILEGRQTSSTPNVKLYLSLFMCFVEFVSFSAPLEHVLDAA